MNECSFSELVHFDVLPSDFHHQCDFCCSWSSSCKRQWLYLLWDFLPIKFLFRIFGRTLQSDAQPIIRWQRMNWQWPVLFCTWKYIWKIHLRNTLQFDQMATNGNKWAGNDQCVSHSSLPRDSPIEAKSFIRYWLLVIRWWWCKCNNDDDALLLSKLMKKMMIQQGW